MILSAPLILMPPLKGQVKVDGLSPSCRVLFVLRPAFQLLWFGFALHTAIALSLVHCWRPFCLVWCLDFCCVDFLPGSSSVGPFLLLSLVCLSSVLLQALGFRLNRLSRYLHEQPASQPRRRSGWAHLLIAVLGPPARA